MSTKTRHTTIGLIIFLVLIIVDSFVVIRFFTNDEYNEVTYSKASLNDYDNIVSTKISEQKNPESYVFNNKDALKNTNDIKLNIENKSKNVDKDIVIDISSRSSSPRKNAGSANIETSEQPVLIEEIKVEETTNKTSNSEKQVSIPADQVSIGTIEIPKTGVNLPILQKVTVAGMEVASCFLYSTGSINVSGTTIIVGHNYCNGKLFSNNKNLRIVDSITITANGITKTYTVYDTFITTDDDISYLDRNTTNEPQIALSTCTNNEQKRLVILAK